MGCDIHLHIEVKLNDKWEHWAAPDIDRDYPLFAKMAGVRNFHGVEPIAEPKGMPHDVTAVTQFERERCGVDGHNHSWFGLEEIKLLAEYVESSNNDLFSYNMEHKILRRSYLCGSSFAGLLEHRSEYPKEITDVRFIFWFDN